MFLLLQQLEQLGFILLKFKQQLSLLVQLLQELEDRFQNRLAQILIQLGPMKSTLNSKLKIIA